MRPTVWNGARDSRGSTRIGIFVVSDALTCSKEAFVPHRGSGLAVSTEQLHAVRDMLSDELVDADSVRVDLSEPNLAKFVVSVGEQQRYRLAVTREFFTVYQTPNAVIAELEIRFVARELRDNPERWLLLDRDGPPVMFDPSGTTS